MICPKCNNNSFTPWEYKGAKFQQCLKCGQLIQIQQSDEYDNYCKEQQSIREQKSSDNKPIVHCPYCNSIDTKKISNLFKAGSVALFGIFALGKTSKQWHCNECGSDF